MTDTYRFDFYPNLDPCVNLVSFDLFSVSISADRPDWNGVMRSGERPWWRQYVQQVESSALRETTLPGAMRWNLKIKKTGESHLVLALWHTNKSAQWLRIARIILQRQEREWCFNYGHNEQIWTNNERISIFCVLSAFTYSFADVLYPLGFCVGASLWRYEENISHGISRRSDDDSL
jgi:hypothetical protein